MRAHTGRSWTGHAIEDGCPCPQEPCGLVDPEKAHPDCEHHPMARSKSIRQSHPADQCPGARQSTDRGDHPMTDTLHTLTIYGASDDCLELEGYINDEYDALRPITLVLRAPTGARIAITAEFDGATPIPGNGWLLSILHADPRWTWPIRLAERPDCSDDPAVVLEVPVGTTVSEVAR